MVDILFCLALAPVALILWYIYKKDMHKEPAGQLAKSFFLGALVTIPVCVIELVMTLIFPQNEYLANSFIYLFIYTFFGVGIIEELFKWLVVRFANYNNNHFDETYDAIVYSVFASLGFAAFENLMYVFSEFLFSGVLASFLTIVLRFVTAVPGHAAFGICMGYFLSKAKIAQTQFDKGKEKTFLFLSILIPTLLHTIYDFLIDTQNILMILIWFVFVIVFYVFAVIMVKKASKNNVHYNNAEILNNKIL